MARLSKADQARKDARDRKRNQREAKKASNIVEVTLSMDGYFTAALENSLLVNNHLLAEHNEPQLDMGEYIELLIANTVAPEAPDYITVDGTKSNLYLNMHEKARACLVHSFYAPADFLELYILRNCGLVDPFATSKKKQLYFKHPCFPAMTYTNLWHGEERCYNPITGIEDGPVRDKYQVRFALREAGCKKIPYRDLQDTYEAECYAAARKQHTAPKKSRAQSFQAAMATSPDTDTYYSRKQTW